MDREKDEKMDREKDEQVNRFIDVVNIGQRVWNGDEVKGRDEMEGLKETMEGVFQRCLKIFEKITQML